LVPGQNLDGQANETVTIH